MCRRGRYVVLDQPQRSARLTLDDLLVELLRRTHEVVGVRDGLWRLIEAVVSVASAELSLSMVLDRIVEVAAEMVDAEYAALGVIGDDGTLREFVHTGIRPETVERIGHLPEGHGILGLLITEPQTLRLDQLDEHPASVGFPAHHPPMDSFLGVPIRVRGSIYGNLYLTNQRGGGFTDDDIELISTLAATAGVVIDNARLHELALRRQQWLEATRHLTAELLSGADEQHVRDMVVERIRDLADGATCVLAAPHPDGLTIVAADGLEADALLGKPFPPADDSPTAQAFAEGRAVTVDDVSSLTPSGDPLVPLAAFGPAMILPMRAQGRITGVVTVIRRKADAGFGPDDVRAAVDLVAHAALAMDYHHAQSQLQRAAVLTDRERIGHDLHDLVIQQLFAAGLELDAASARIEDPAVGGPVGNAVDHIDAAISDLRSSIFGLHARRRGSSTVRGQLDDICRTAAGTLGFAPDYDVAPTVDSDVPDEVVVDLLAATRELLSNASRHARASKVTLRVHVTDATLHLEVSDDGRGIPKGGRRSGLRNLAARAERCGGAMRIDSDASGTHIHWHVPVP